MRAPRNSDLFLQGEAELNASDLSSVLSRIAREPQSLTAVRENLNTQWKPAQTYLNQTENMVIIATAQTTERMILSGLAAQWLLVREEESYRVQKPELGICVGYSSQWFAIRCMEYRNACHGPISLL